MKFVYCEKKHTIKCSKCGGDFQPTVTSTPNVLETDKKELYQENMNNLSKLQAELTKALNDVEEKEASEERQHARLDPLWRR